MAHIFQVNHFDDSEGTLTTWYGTRAEAEGHVEELKELEPEVSTIVHEHSIGDTKAQLLEWLNIHCTHDNG